MTLGIGEVLTSAIGVAISPVPIIAVILMLFSKRARVNGPMFGIGWAVALAVVSGVAYFLADAGNAATDSAAADTVSWTQILIGVLFLLLAGRSCQDAARLGEELARRAQRCRDDRAVPRLWREPHCQGHPTADLMTK
jgi:hypothetical protein